jgi:hypothetical protein
MRGRTLWLTLSWLWLAVLLVYLVWGGIAQAGLYYWVGTLEVDRFGSYDPKLTGIVPGLLLAVPSLVYLGREARRRRRAPPDPAAAARTLRLAAFVLIGLGVAALAGAVAFYVAAQGLPDGAGRAMPFDATALGSGPAPAWKVRIAGAIDARAEASVSESSRFSSATTTYSGFRPDGEADKNAPLRLFVEHRVRDESGPAVLYLGNEERGYLVENGLPPLIFYALERQGVRIASPHYLLRTGSGVSRDPYYVGAALGALFGCLLTGIGALLLILPKRGVASGTGPAGG